MEIAKIRVQLDILHNDMTDAVEDKDFLKAQEIKVKVEALLKEQAELEEKLTEIAERAPKVITPVAPMIPQAEEERPQTQSSQKERNDDPVLIQKCLEMIVQLLQDPKINRLNPILQTLLEEFILPSIQNLKAEIRMTAVKAMTLCCLRCPKRAKQQMLLLLQVKREKISVLVLSSFLEKKSLF